MMKEFEPTIALQHRKGSVITAEISAELAQKIFRLVTDELNGLEEGPQVNMTTEPETSEETLDNIKCYMGKILDRPCLLTCDKNSVIKPCETVSDETKEALTEQLRKERTCPNGRIYSADCKEMKWHEGLCNKATNPKPCEVNTSKVTMDKILRDEQGQTIGKGPLLIASMDGLVRPKEGPVEERKELYMPLCACGCGKPVTKPTNKYLRGHSSSKRENPKDKENCKWCGSKYTDKYGTAPLKKGGYSQKWMCKDCNRTTTLKHMDESEEKATKEVFKQKNQDFRDARVEPKENRYSHLKTVSRTPEDLMIITEEVMCPKTGITRSAESCRECEAYIATIKTIETGEPHVRCLKAKV